MCWDRFLGKLYPTFVLFFIIFLFICFTTFVCLFVFFFNIYISGHLKPLLCELFCDSRISSWIIIFQVLSHFLSSIFGVILIDANIMVQIPSMETGTKTSGPDQFRKINWIDLIERNRNIYGRSKITLRLANLKRVTSSFRSTGRRFARGYSKNRNNKKHLRKVA